MLSEGNAAAGLTTGRALPSRPPLAPPPQSHPRSLLSPQTQHCRFPLHPSVRGNNHKKDDDDRLRRLRNGWGNAYELSQELHDKQVQMLERKYGGPHKAQWAARCIQHVYRNYCMNKKFGQLRDMFDERRLSRRFDEFSRSKTIWTDRATGCIDSEVSRTGFKTRYYSSEEVGAAMPITYQCSQEQLGSCVSVHRECVQSTSCSRTIRVSQTTTQISNNRATKGGLSLDLSTIAENLPSVTVTTSPSGHCYELDSSASDSPHEAPVDGHLDLPSVNFENLLEYRELEVFNDSFHSDSSHEGTGPHADVGPNGTLTRTAIPVYGGDSPIYTEHPVYDNSEVRLRKSKADGCGTLTRDGSDCERHDTHSLGSCDGRSVGSDQEHGGLSSHGSEVSMGSNDGSNTYNRCFSNQQYSSSTLTRGNDKQRKRTYRVGLNLFNKRPEKGIRYLIEHGFIHCRPSDVAAFLIKRKGLSKQMIGEYLGNLQSDFNMAVLDCFASEIDLTGLEVDVALRKFQSYFRMPGEAQKIERLMEEFASRYCDCNPDYMKKLRNTDSIFLMAFAIIMLNTDLHNRSIKPERKMKCQAFIKNLRGVDAGGDFDSQLLTGIYERIKQSELRPSSDHVSQVIKVENMIVGKKPALAVPHRRLVCYCRLYEVQDTNKKEKLGLHQREVFLFNDLLLVTKIFSKKKSNTTYTFRQSFPLVGMIIYLFDTPYYKYGIRLTSNLDSKALITFNARSDHDRTKFVEDLKEAVFEMNEMDKLRINEELSKQRIVQVPNANRFSKDSGVVDVDTIRNSESNHYRLSAPECQGMRKNTLSNSLLDINEGTATRRNSGGSLDSGMASEGRGSQEDNSSALTMIPPSVSGSSSLFAPPQPYTKAMKLQQQAKSVGGGGGRPLPPPPVRKMVT